MTALFAKSGVTAGASGVVLTARPPRNLAGGGTGTTPGLLDFAARPSRLRQNGGGAPSSLPRRHLIPLARGGYCAPFFLLELPGASASGAFSPLSGGATRVGPTAPEPGRLVRPTRRASHPPNAAAWKADTKNGKFRRCDPSASVAKRKPWTFGRLPCPDSRSSARPAFDPSGAVAGSSGMPRRHQGPCVMPAPQTAAPLTECATFNRHGAAA